MFHLRLKLTSFSKAALVYLVYVLKLHLPFFGIGPIPSRASIWCLKHKQHPREDYYCTCALILTYLRGCQRSLPHSFQDTNHGPAVQKAHRFSPPCIGTGYLCQKIITHKAVRSSIAQTSVSVICTFLPRNAVLATARSDFQRPADWSEGCQRLPGQSQESPVDPVVISTDALQRSFSGPRPQPRPLAPTSGQASSTRIPMGRRQSAKAAREVGPWCESHLINWMIDISITFNNHIFLQESTSTVGPSKPDFRNVLKCVKNIKEHWRPEQGVRLAAKFSSSLSALTNISNSWIFFEEVLTGNGTCKQSRSQNCWISHWQELLPICWYFFAEPCARHWEPKVPLSPIEFKRNSCILDIYPAIPSGQASARSGRRLRWAIAFSEDQRKI